MNQDDPNDVEGSGPQKTDAPATAEELYDDQLADRAALHAVGEGLPMLGTLAAGLDEAEAEPSSEAVPASALSESRAEARRHLEARPVRQAAEEPVRQSQLVLERKHPLAIRWMHWINFPVLFTMIYSGILIYWNDSIPPGRYAHQVYRVGLGHWTLFRFFPEWVYSGPLAPYKVTLGLGLHFYFMWFFLINGVAYVTYLLWSREWKFMVPQRESFVQAIQVTLKDLHLRKELPPQTKYNGAQRIAYSTVLVMGLGSLVTGLAIYKPTQAHWLTSALGGYEMARWLHFLLTLGFCGFFLVHVGQVILAGWNNFRSMVSGYEIRRADAPSLEAERRRF